MIGIGILGCGRIGQVHADSVISVAGARLVAVADVFAESAAALAARSGAEARSADEIVTAPDVDAVVICTPTDTHYDLIHAAAAAGKAIFCEKPVDMSADRIRECIRVVDAAGVAFMTGFNRRFDRSFSGLQSRIREGEIGEVEIVTILSRDPSPPPLSYVRSSGGLFRDMMIHDLDMARFLLGEEPRSVYAVGSALVDPEVGKAGDVDTAAVILTTGTGRICQISNSRRAGYGYDQRIEVHGSVGMLRADNQLENSVEVATAEGFRRAPAMNFFLERYRDAYRIEMEQFVAALNAGTPPSPTIADGLAAQLLADAATRSRETGQPVILTAP